MYYKKKMFIRIKKIIFLIIILFLIYIHLINNYSKQINVSKIKNTYDEIRNKLKDGDLILFSNSDEIGNTIRFWADDYFTHSGIVFWIDNHPYILEADVNKDLDYTLFKKKEERI